MPKFLQEDLKLFSGIVSDLFPTIKEEETDYGILDKAIRKACEKSNLKDVDGEPLAPGLPVLEQPPWGPGQGLQDGATWPQARSSLAKCVADQDSLPSSPRGRAGDRGLGESPLSHSCLSPDVGVLPHQPIL